MEAGRSKKFHKSRKVHKSKTHKARKAGRKSKSITKRMRKTRLQGGADNIHICNGVK